MELVLPGIGLIFWMSLSFITVLLILKKFAWKPILNAIKNRENEIRNNLNKAEKTRQEMLALKAHNEEINKQAKEEKAELLKDARIMRDKIIEDAENKAKEKYQAILDSAINEIENRKLEAMTELKNQIAFMSIDIAEKIIKENLSKDQKQTEYINKIINEINFN